jgi:N-acylneuraminate cytidylyltransferase
MERGVVSGMTIAIIPARGGSKGIPRKNLAPLAGKPLLVWTIESAREAREVDAVYVSTDDAKIAACARAHGAEPILRPADISGDTSPSEAALLHALDVVEATRAAVDLVVFLQATSPFRRPGFVSEALKQFRASGADSMLAAARAHILLWRQTPEGARAINYDPAHRPMRQQMEPQFRETGSLYITTARQLRASGNRLGGRIALFEITEDEALDIDSPADLDYAEWKMRRESTR